jgi:hypothetical protein
MKNITRISIILLVLTCFLFLTPNVVFAQDSGGSDGKVVFGGSYTLEDGQSLNGDLAIFGGNAEIKEGATVNGSIFVSGGSLKVGGTVNGDIAGIGGTIILTNTSVIHGDVVMVGGYLDRSPKASISGEVTTGAPRNLDLKLPDQIFPSILASARTFDVFSSVRNVLRSIVMIFALSALAVLVALFLPKHTRRVADSINNQPVLASGFGLLTAVVAPGIIAFVTLTCILSPIGMAALLVLAVASVFGWIALGDELGRRMAASMKVEWSEPLSAGVGTFLITLVSSLVSIICCGFIIPILLGIVGLGGVIISRFGTQVYPTSKMVGTVNSEHGEPPSL